MKGIFREKVLLPKFLVRKKFGCSLYPKLNPTEIFDT